MDHADKPMRYQGPLDLGHSRSEYGHGGIPVCEPRLRGADQPPVRDAHAACGGVLAVNGQELAVVASDRTERRA